MLKIGSCYKVTTKFYVYDKPNGAGSAVAYRMEPQIITIVDVDLHKVHPYYLLTLLIGDKIFFTEFGKDEVEDGSRLKFIC